jgi:oligosaccharide repeat unit polymerase
METLIWGVLLLLLGWALYRLAGSMRFLAVIAVAMFTIMYLANIWGAVGGDYPFETRHSIYLFMTLLVFGGAMVIGMRSRRSVADSPTRVDIPDQRLAIIIPFLLVAGMSGAALWTLDILRSGGGASMLSSGNLYDLRVSFLDRSTSFLGQIGSFLYGCALPGLVLGLRQWLKGSSSKQNQRLLSVLLLGLVLVMGAVSLVSGGRQSVQTILVSIVAVLFYGGWSSYPVLRRRTFLLVGTVVVIAAVGYYITVVNQRAVFSNQSEDYLLAISNSYYSDWFYNLSEKLPPSVTRLVAALHLYYPRNLTNLAKWMDGLDTSNLGWGRMQGSHIMRQLDRLGIVAPYELTLNTDYVTAYVSWPTMIGAMVVDFGLTGALLEFALFGWLLGAQYGNLIYSRTNIGYLFTSLGLVFIVHGLMYSPFGETLLLYGLIWSLVVTVWSCKRMPVDKAWSRGLAPPTAVRPVL